MRDKLIEALDNSSAKYTIGLSQIYETFPDKENITKEKYIEVCKTFNYALMRTLIETGNTYVLPQRLGLLSIRKRKKTNRRFFNLKLFLDEGVKSYYDNRHSGGYYARFNWDKKPPVCSCKNIQMVKFTASRVHKRYLASQILDNNYIVKYFDHD